jgi:hypothetical protein
MIDDRYYGQKITLRDGVEVAPAILVYDNVIDNPEQLIDFALLRPEKWRDSMVSDGEEGVVDKEVRNTRILDVPATYDNDIKWFEVSQLVWTYANRYSMQYDAGFSNMESLQLLHYSTNEGFYKPHFDSGPGMQRIFSALLYLNDVKSGGETYFNEFDVSVKPKAGRLALFPANFVYTHEARTPKSNDKFVLVTWFTPLF